MNARIFLLVSLFLSLLSSQALSVEQCTDVFPDPATSFSPSGSIVFKTGSSRLFGGNAAINFNNIDQKGNSNCSGSRCTQTGTTSESLTLSSFQLTSSNSELEIDSNQTLAQGDYKKIEVEEDVQLTFSGSSVTRVDEVIVDEGGTLVLNEGTYWISKLELDEEAEIVLPAGDSVVIYVNELVLDEETLVNTSNDADAGQLLIVSYDTIVVDDKATINAFLYAVNSVVLDKNINFTGSISTASLELDANTSITYDSDQLATLASSGLCTAGVTSTIAYYSIVHPAAGLTCDSSQVVISACTDASCSLSTQATQISFPGATSGTQALSFIGQISVTLQRSSAQTLALDLVPLDVESTPSGATQCNGNCTIEFREAAFVFVDQNNGLSTTLPDIIAESDLSRIGLRAIQDNEGVCEAALVGAQTVQLGFDCVSDPDNYSTNICQVPFANVSVQGDGSGISSGNVSLTFDANGIASLSGTYNDVGRLNLFASGTFSTFSLDSGPTGVNFDSIPQQLEIVQTSTSEHVAGDQFSVTVQALGAQNNVMPSYSPASLLYQFTRITPDDALSASLESNLSLGTDAILVSALSPDFQSVSSLSFSNGVYENSAVTNSEVGVYSLELQDSNYLGNTVTSNVVQMGRFIPAYFDVTTNTPNIEPTCSSVFTYIGQFSEFELGREPIYTVTAYNALGAVTNLYSDESWRLNPALNSVTDNLQTNDQSAFSMEIDEETSSLEFNVGNNQDFDGNGEFLLNNLRVAYEKTASLDNSLEPFATQFELVLGRGVFTDSDGVCYRTDYVDESNRGSCSSVSIGNIGSAEQRYGRLALVNTYGPENRSLRVPIRAEYYNRGDWLTNADDNCTDINFAQIDDEITLTNASAVNESNIAGQYTTISSSGFLTSGLSGTDDLVFDAPTGGERGSVLVELNPNATSVDWPEFLNFDWNNDGAINTDDTPSASVSFGLFRGNDRIFHTREVN